MLGAVVSVPCNQLASLGVDAGTLLGYRAEHAAAPVLQQTVHVIDFARTPPVTRFWQRLRGIEILPRLRCCMGADAEAFLLWWPGGLPIVWTPAAGYPILLESPYEDVLPIQPTIRKLADSDTGHTCLAEKREHAQQAHITKSPAMHAGAEWLDAGGNVLAACTRPDGQAWVLLSPAAGVLEYPASALAEDALEDMGEDDAGGLLPSSALQPGDRPGTGGPARA